MMEARDTISRALFQQKQKKWACLSIRTIPQDVQQRHLTTSSIFLPQLQVPREGTASACHQSF